MFTKLICKKQNCTNIYDDFLSKIKEPYIKESIKNDLHWYINKTKTSKQWYLVLSFFSIVLPLVVAVVNAIEDKNVTVSIITATNSFVCSWLAFRTYHVSWVKYGMVAENIKKEIRYMITKADHYSQIDEESKRELELFCNVEKITEAERNTWSNFVINKKDNYSADKNKQS
jgi:hypothetical protein